MTGKIMAWSIAAKGGKSEVRAAVEAVDLHDHGGADEAASVASLAAAKVEILRRVDALPGDGACVFAHGYRADLHGDAPVIDVIPI